MQFNEQSGKQDKTFKRAHVLKELQEIFSMSEDHYTIAQNLWSIMRRKENLVPPYEWTDDQLLRKLNSYKRELKDDILGEDNPDKKTDNYGNNESGQKFEA